MRDLTVVIGEDEEQVLKHVSFNLHPGEKIAIVGRPGAEKEALVSCLFRFTEPVRGYIKVDGVNVAWVNDSLQYKSAVYDTYCARFCRLACRI